MNKIGLFAPQWQGSGKTMELYYGALALRQYLGGRGDLKEIPVSESIKLAVENNIYGYKAIHDQLMGIRNFLEKSAPDKIFTIGGGCGIEVPVVSYLGGIYQDTDILWFDAHGDLNTPLSSPSKYFHGMALRFLIENIDGNGISESFSSITDPGNIILIGTRDLDPPERDFVAETRLKLVPVISDTDNLKNEILEKLDTGNRHVFIHIDLDVLDPAEYRNVKCPCNNGMTIRQLEETIGIIRSFKNIVGFSILENTETDSTEISKLEKIINYGLEI